MRSRHYAYIAQASASVVFTMQYFAATGEGPQFRLEALTAFNVDAPFSHRILIPAIAHGISEIISITPFRLYEILTALFLFGALLSFAAVLRQWYGEARSQWLSLLLLYPMAFNYIILGDYLHPWDIPSISFFVAGLLAIMKGRYWHICLIIAIATMNRETAVVLALAYALLRWHESGVVARSIGLAAIWLVVKGAIMITASSGGSVYVNATAENIEYLSRLLHGDRYYWSLALRIFGGLHILFVALIWQLPANMRRLALIAFALPVPLFFTGIFTEERIFNEMNVIFALTAILSFVKVPSGLKVDATRGRAGKNREEPQRNRSLKAIFSRQIAQ